MESRIYEADDVYPSMFTMAPTCFTYNWYPIIHLQEKDLEELLGRFRRGIWHFMGLLAMEALDF